MAQHEFFAYPPVAISYDASGAVFRLKSSFRDGADRTLVQLSDHGLEDAGSQPAQTFSYDGARGQAVALNRQGNAIASGTVTIEQEAVLQISDGPNILLERIEIDGELVGFVSSEPLTPGASYQKSDGHDTRFCTGDPDRLGWKADFLQQGVTCFGPATMITTEEGEVPVEWLDTSDKVLTRDHGYQPILWIGRTKLPQKYFDQYSDERPVCIPAGSLSENCPTHDLQISGNHRVMIRSPQAELMFFSSEVLAPAKAWVDFGTAETLRPARTYTLTHILCASHEVIMAQGAWVESMFTSAETLRRLDARIQKHLKDLLGGDLGRLGAARPCLTRSEALMLLMSSQRPTDMLDDQRYARPA